MKVIGIIPARKGSKGLPDKNIKIINGIPLMAWSIKAAQESKLIDDVYVTSDDFGYLETALLFGANPLERKEGLAKDTTSIKDVLLDVRDKVESDAMVVLYPTYPMRNGEDVDQFVQIATNKQQIKPLIGAIPPKTHPYLCYQDINTSYPGSRHIFERFINDKIKYRRQEYPEYWAITHWACVVPTKELEALNPQLMRYDTYFYKLPSPRKAVDIDTQEDFEYAEYLMEKDK